ncbi:unnamed protein product [Diamesa serratosioi]
MSKANKRKVPLKIAYETDEKAKASNQENEVSTILMKPNNTSESMVKDAKLLKFVPKNWKELYANIKIMRKSMSAPVDNLGCEQSFDKDTDAKNQRYQILVSLMLSSQTRDQITHAACQRLREFSFNPEVIAKIDTQILADLIKPVGFYRVKAKHIKMTSAILLEQYAGDIPPDIPGLLKLPGVGAKMAHICMHAAWNVTSGIGVDVHVHRISNRLKFTSKETKLPEKTRLELESWMPFELWGEVNLLFVGFGQTICKPVGPNCAECLNNKICPSAFQKSPRKQKTTKTSKE